MGILAWIVIGALAGWIASMIMKTNIRGGNGPVYSDPDRLLLVRVVLAGLAESAPE